MLTVRDISCVRQERVLFSNVSFSLKPSEVLYITGPNGCGKTSLLQILVGLLSPYQGEILWNNVSIKDLDADYTTHMAYVGHKIGIKSTLTVWENLQLASDLLSVNPVPIVFDVVNDPLDLYGVRDMPCSRLSAGQKQRVALARLWVNKASLWVLDEPFTSLDQGFIQVLETAIVKHCENRGMVVLTSHAPLRLGSVKMIPLKLA